MPKIVERQEFDLLEPGVYLAEVIDYTDTRDDGTPLMSGTRYGDAKPQWRFKFELLDYPEPDRQISAWVTKPKDMDAIAQNSTLTALATALLGVGLEDEWEIEDLLHKRCRVQVEWFRKENGTDGAKIGKFYALKKSDAPPAPAPIRAVPRQEPVPTVAQRRAATAPTLDPDSVPF